MIKYSLTPKSFPSFKEVWRKTDTSKLINEKSGKTALTYNVIVTYVLGFLRYGQKIYVVPLKYFVILTVLTGYVPECPIVGFRT